MKGGGGGWCVRRKEYLICMIVVVAWRRKSNAQTQHIQVSRKLSRLLHKVNIPWDCLKIFYLQSMQCIHPWNSIYQAGSYLDNLETTEIQKKFMTQSDSIHTIYTCCSVY